MTTSIKIMPREKGKKLTAVMNRRDINKIDKTILDNFYKLVHNQPNVRLTAAVSTFKILTAMKKRSPDSFNEHLNYCVERLVTGLTSSRASARQGYGTLLLEILKTYQVSTERLFAIAQQKFGNISNEATKDNLLGYFLLVSIVLESGNYKKSKQAAKFIEIMYRYLTQLRNQKSYFEYPVSKLLQSNSDVFYDCMLADIPPGALESDAVANYHDLLTIALCNKKNLIRQLRDIDANAIRKLSSSLSNEKLQRKPLHPVWFEHSATIMNCFPDYFGDYCSTILHQNFFKQNHNELASLGLQLISSLIASKPNETSAIDALLSDYVVRLLIVSLRTRNKLYGPCVEFFKSINKFFKDTIDDVREQFIAVKYHILVRLTSAPGTIAFDDDSKSQSLVNLLNESPTKILNSYLNRLIGFFVHNEGKKEANKIYSACAKQMAHIIRRPQMISEHLQAQKLCKFVIVHSLFARVEQRAVEKKFWSKHDVAHITHDLDMSVKEALKSVYHAVMDRFVSSCNAQQRIEQFRELQEFSNELIASNAVEFSKSSDDILKLWHTYRVSLGAHFKLIDKQKDAKILYPITSLYLFYGFQILEHGLDCIEQLEDLDKSAQEALKDDPNDGSWADVLTDQIIAILSATECSPWIRKLCVSVFGSLLPHISETSIDLLCDVIKSPLDEECDEDDSEMNTGDEDDNIDADETERISEDESEESGSDSSGVENDSDEEDDDNMSVDCDTAQLGKSSPDDTRVDASIDNEEEEEEEEYLDDEQMMKYDTVLADMFKLNRIGKKNKRDPSFKLRCLDLVKKVMLKKRNDAEVIKKILGTIVPLANKSRKSIETRPIADKIDRIARIK